MRRADHALGSIAEVAMNKALQAMPLDGFRLWLKFEDGAEGTVDLGDLAGRGVCNAWPEGNIFDAVSVNYSGAIVWPGEIDLCPDALNIRLTGRQAEERLPGLMRIPADA